MSELRAQQERFTNNRLIDKIKNEPYWTVSDDKKRPLDANLLILHPAKFALASFKNDNWPLVPLTDLDNDDRLTYTNRAYRLHAEDNRVICIDMEKTASTELRESLKKFPVDYAEISLSGSGIHYLIEIPEDLIPDEAKYLFDDQVVVKSDDGSFEVFFNDHYVTLTKNILPPSEYTLKRVEEEPEHRRKITRMLLMLADIQKARKSASALSDEFIPDTICDDLTPYEQELEIMLKKKLPPYGHFSFKTLSDYQMDHSRYELYLATSIASRAINIHEELQKLLAGDKETLNRCGAYKNYPEEKKQEWIGWDQFDINEEETRNHLAGIVYNVLCSKELQEEHILDPRPKHKEFRNGIPWLMDRAVRGTGFACSRIINEEREQEKEADNNSMQEYMKARLGVDPKKG